MYLTRDLTRFRFGGVRRVYARVDTRVLTYDSPRDLLADVTSRSGGSFSIRRTKNAVSDRPVGRTEPICLRRKNVHDVIFCGGANDAYNARVHTRRDWSVVTIEPTTIMMLRISRCTRESVRKSSDFAILFKGTIFNRTAVLRERSDDSSGFRDAGGLCARSTVRNVTMRRAKILYRVFVILTAFFVKFFAFKKKTGFFFKVIFIYIFICL